MASKGIAALEAMIEEATVDAYGDDEQLTGLFTMIEEHLAVPFTTTVLGMRGDRAEGRPDRRQHRRGLRPRPPPAEDRPARPAAAHPHPDGAAWIDAYRHWAGR